MPCFRAGCAGFVVGSGEEREFWVMGGYGESRTMLGLFPMDEYYRDAVVMKLKDGGRSRAKGKLYHSFGFVALNSELFVMTLQGVDAQITREIAREILSLPSNLPPREEDLRSSVQRPSSAL
ncbi:hypothetical protein Nepgr_002029 [Nepenthes gracilis]|uniref:Uncharacterized protein n=1 Tax=Nepenthes gracilis TaxID=150966 RepID=A0AAD3P776_NEPGR|nr:hypothetical protein Nepgr_002029 [Nepenthes gracilis]